MFTITVQFHMKDTIKVIHDNPAAVLDALKMSAVLSVVIISNMGD